MNDAATTPSGGSTHGFLFADLRGYAQLVDTRGALEASHVLERYRAIVREVVARDGGAEIKTEGDSFYLVLPSASAALRCGLDILAACARPADGGEAIAVGVGIHAGESVAHEGGFVSSAVNIAARICALAAPGELLASGTIRELTRSIVAAQFVFVGRRQLKGLAEPVELFRVVPEGAAVPLAGGRRDGASARRAMPRLAIAAVAIALVTSGAAIVLAQRPATGPAAPGGSASPTGSAGASASQVAASPSGGLARLPGVSAHTIPTGTYAPNLNRDVAAVTLADPGWTLQADAEDLLYFRIWATPPSGGLETMAGVGLARISVVYTGPCPDDPTRLLGDRPQDLIEWVQSAPQFEPSQPRSVIDLGRSGIGIEATVRPPPTGGCAGQNPSSVWLWGVSGGSWTPNANVGLRVLFEALEDGPRTLTVVYTGRADVLPAFETGLSRRLLQSIVLNP
jgi:class 3 adenylate cyclase